MLAGGLAGILFKSTGLETASWWRLMVSAAGARTSLVAGALGAAAAAAIEVAKEYGPELPI